MVKYRLYFKLEWIFKVKEFYDIECLKRKIWLVEGCLRGMFYEFYRDYKWVKR